jgi:uncharacterized protein
MAASPWILDTASGARIDLDDPRPADIRLEDIAGALAEICRFGAQTKQFYSVAQHALLVRRLVLDAGHDDLELIALHHDSHEAFVGDLPTPLKRRIDSATPTYRELCARLDRAIAASIGVSWPRSDSPSWVPVREADELALRIEAAVLLPNAPWTESIAGTELGNPMAPQEAEAAFLDAHRVAADRASATAV